ncbi:interferon-induced 35 kDa protein homolog isoform X1 [Salmo salar]|uniref:Interferon-induced 35 kDa protein homolog isoform X1 n=2 Tax=Salmo salar TaxID=8030 RepID=A0ABM3EGT0_SALSA|nr:interferon-induced 35 kDa protein homolog isoform X1 [Salmo salar]
MSFFQDFSLMSHTQESQNTLDGILNAISKCKVQHNQLLKEQQDLSRARDDQEDLAKQFRQRIVKLRISLEEDDNNQARDVDSERKKIAALHDEESRLKREIQRAEEELQLEEESTHHLKQQTNVSTAAVPEKKVVFTGVTGDGANTLNFDVKPHIVFPMEEGTALITFEDEEVAQKILSLREHKVDLGEDCAITLEAKLVQLLVPCQVEMDTEVCSRRILVSNLPKKVREDLLLDKLEIHFAKSKNGGGEVEDSDMLHDSGNVVITFTENNIAKGLTDKQYHNVEFEKGRKHSVKVTPFLNGDITSFQTRLSACGRTVLLTGIPAVKEQENLQDLLEIHFQKTSNGGGEVDTFLYNPLGQHTLALFEEDCPTEDQSQ